MCELGCDILKFWFLNHINFYSLLTHTSETNKGNTRGEY